MTQSIESQAKPEGFEVIETTDAGIAVRLPNGYEVNVANVANSEEAIAKSSAYYENLKQNRDKDELTYTDMLSTNREFLTQLRKSYAYRDSANQDEDWFKEDAEIVNYFVNDMRWRDNNTVSMVKSVLRTGSAGDEEKERTAYLFGVWDQMPDFWETGGSGFKGLMNNIKAGAADPTSYIGAGLFAVGKRVALGVVGKEATKQVIQRSAPSQIARAAAANGAADAGMSGAFSYLDQTQRKEVGMIEDIDYNQVMYNTAIGALGGAGFGGAASAIGKTKPVRAIRESQTIKNAGRKAQLLTRNWLTSTSVFDSDSAQRIRTAGGQEAAAKQELANIEFQTEQQILKAFDAEDQNYNEWVLKNSTEVSELIKTYNNAGKKVDTLNDEPSLVVLDDNPEAPVNVSISTNDELYRNILINNPELKENFDKLANMQTTSRVRTADRITPEDKAANPFADSPSLHQTVTYYAFTDTDFNLKRLTKTDKGKVQFNNAVKYIKKDGKIDDVTAQNVVGSLARGRLDEAKRVANEAGVDLGEFDEFIYNANIEDVSDISKIIDPTKTELEPSVKLAGKEKQKEILKRREDIPKEIRDVLGIVDDPLSRVTEATYRLGSFERALNLQEELALQFIKTKQIDKFGGNTAFLDTPLKEIKREIKTATSTTTVELKTKTLRQAVQDGDINTPEAMRRVIDENEILRERAYNKAISDVGGKIYNPLAILNLDKDFKDYFNQAMHGSFINLKGDTVVGNAFQALHTTNYVASSMKTVFSPATQALNFVGGLSNFVVANGFRTNAVNASYIKNTYLPIFSEILRGNINKENSGQLLTRLSKKYPQKQVNEIMEDFRFLTEARILDSDLISDFGKMIRGQTKVGEFTESIYDASGSIRVKHLSEFTKRLYASSDEMFKVLAFKDRKEFYLNKLGYTKDEAVKRATKDIYRWYPNYRFQPKVFKALRSVGLGNFISHTVEVCRNTKNICVDTSEQIAEGARLVRQGKGKEGRLLISDASRRGARAFAVIGAGSYLATEAGEVFGGEKLSEAEKNGLTAFNSKFQGNELAGFVATKKDGNGNLTGLNTSLTNPYGMLTNLMPMIFRQADEAMQRGVPIEQAYTDSISKAVVNFTRQFRDPTLGSAPLFKFVGAHLMGDGDAKEGEFIELAKGVGKSFLPGAITEINNYWKFSQGAGADTEYAKGAEGKYLSPGTRGLRLAGLRPTTLNFKKLTTDTYRGIKFSYRESQSSFSSLLSREGLTSRASVGDELALATKYYSGIPAKNILGERRENKIDAFVEKYVEANNERFLLERELYGKALAHVNYLREQANYKGDDGKIAKEVDKRMKDAGISKETRTKLISAAAFNNDFPRYTPFLISEPLISKTFENLINSNRVSNDDAVNTINELRSKIFEASREFQNRPLTIRNADEDE